jgi:hypothetical protein
MRRSVVLAVKQLSQGCCEANQRFGAQLVQLFLDHARRVQAAELAKNLRIVEGAKRHVVGLEDSFDDAPVLLVQLAADGSTPLVSGQRVVFAPSVGWPAISVDTNRVQYAREHVLAKP